jgi:hypothetical protein
MERPTRTLHIQWQNYNGAHVVGLGRLRVLVRLQRRRDLREVLRAPWERKYLITQPLIKILIQLSV